MSLAHAGNIFDAQMKQRANRAADGSRDCGESKPFQKSQQILSRRLAVVFQIYFDKLHFYPIH